MRKWILPVIAVAAVIVAVIVVLISPGKNEGKENSASESPAVVSDSDVITGSDKDLLIRKTELSTEKVSFIRPIEESKIELLARIGEDGEILVPAYDIDLKLHEGENHLTFVPYTVENVPYCCWMGMIKSSITVVD